MDFIKNMALMLLIIIFCIGILKLMIPRGNMKKITSMLVSVLFVFLVISVFKNADGILDIDSVLGKIESVGAVEGNNDFREGVTYSVTSQVEKSIQEEILKRTNLKNVKVVVTPLFEEEKIILESVKIYIEENFDEDEIKNIVSNKFKIEKTKITVSGK